MSYALDIVPTLRVGMQPGTRSPPRRFDNNSKTGFKPVLRSHTERENGNSTAYLLNFINFVFSWLKFRAFVVKT